MRVLQRDAVLKNMCELAGEVDARSHALSVNPNMKRVRCAGQSWTIMQPTGGAGCWGAAPAAARLRAKCSAGETSMSGATIWWSHTMGMCMALSRKRS